MAFYGGQLIGGKVHQGVSLNIIDDDLVQELFLPDNVTDASLLSVARNAETTLLQALLPMFIGVPLAGMLTWAALGLDQ